ncbi:MAG: hypothetical protein JSV23_07435 [Promethearchaeota archaeon]|nr:MAG: hypothetical protein JSV23_07435 [Candidatus Lokiarchaeota archaeon]
MPVNNSSSAKIKLKIQINNLITIYEQKAECGIFFKLNEEKSPLEILGVLDFLKERIKKWGNTNLFSYHGNLFNKNTIIVVGARDLEEATSIMIYMFLSNIVENEYEFNNLIEKLGYSTDIEQFLRDNISENIEKGYPTNSDLEMKLVNHLDGICKNQDGNNPIK